MTKVMFYFSRAPVRVSCLSDEVWSTIRLGTKYAGQSAIQSRFDRRAERSLAHYAEEARNYYATLPDSGRLLGRADVPPTCPPELPGVPVSGEEDP